MYRFNKLTSYKATPIVLLCILILGNGCFLAYYHIHSDNQAKHSVYLAEQKQAALDACIRNIQLNAPIGSIYGNDDTAIAQNQEAINVQECKLENP
jgi:hypothetical protein